MAITLNLQVQRDSGPLILNLAPTGDNRTVTIAGRGRVTGLASLGMVTTSTIVGVTAGCRGGCAAAYDPNLLSAFHAVSDSAWNDGAALNQGQPSSFEPAFPLIAANQSSWIESELLQASPLSSWASALALHNSVAIAWNEGESRDGATQTVWQSATRLWHESATLWNAADSINQSTIAGYQPRLPLLSPDYAIGWNDGLAMPMTVDSPANDGTRLEYGFETLWNDAGLAYNAWKPPVLPPEPPQPPARPLILNLKNYRASSHLVLNLGHLYPAWDVADRRYYAVLNTCSVVRLPERTELPVTAVSLECNADSWGWSISLSLAGPDGWTLCQPGANSIPQEVEITINGTVWTALLDDPQLTRGFNSRKITAKGMSRSGWLTAPFAPSTTVSYSAPRTAQQVAEEILDGTGWALDWQLPKDPQWLIPPWSYLAAGTPLERLIMLVGAVKGCLYSDPASYVLTAYPRYPTLPWHWNAALVDVALPEAALLSWNQTQRDLPSLNRVYVSGTTAGVLLELTRAGTAGDLQPATPIVDALLTDSYSARARAECELSQSGPGYDVQVETILGGVEQVPLIRPGLLCTFAGIRGIVRSCSINAARNGGGLAVRQGLKLERRL